MKAVVKKLRKWDGAEWYAVGSVKRLGKFVEVVAVAGVDLPEGVRQDGRHDWLINRNGEVAGLVAVGGLIVAPFPSGALEVCKKF